MKASPFLLASLLALSACTAGCHDGAAADTWFRPAGTSKNRVINAKDGSELIRIEPGEFLVGALENDLEARDNEGPSRRVRVTKPFWVARYEVTNEQYERFVQATGHPAPNTTVAPDYWPGGKCPEAIKKQPVVHVSWDDARAYCRWAGVRLLTEAEWEYVARGDTQWVYPFGNTFLPELANCDRGRERSVEAVGQRAKGASPFGVENLAGNVSEWVADTYTDERWGQLADGAPADINERGIGRVFKGGAYTLPKKCARISCRDRTNPEAKAFFLGFRVCRDG